jgi:hypothetical protein
MNEDNKVNIIFEFLYIIFSFYFHFFPLNQLFLSGVVQRNSAYEGKKRNAMISPTAISVYIRIYPCKRRIVISMDKEGKKGVNQGF